jgi:hypothetical protein
LDERSFVRPQSPKIVPHTNVARTFLILSLLGLRPHRNASKGIDPEEKPYGE